MKGSVCLSFSGNAYQENARQTFLLCCLMLIGAQFVEQEQYLYGCVLSWKAGLCRVELWTSLDDMETLKLITKQIFSIMNQFHKEVKIKIIFFSYNDSLYCIFFFFLVLPQL
jgi:hypothetical protein